MTLAPASSAATLLLLALSFVPSPPQVTRTAVPSGTWRIDPARSLVQFTVTKLGFADVTGRFMDFSGTVRYDASAPDSSTVQWAVRVGSVRTDAANRDATLQAPEYFDTRQHPELTFRSVRVRALHDGRLEVDGELTMKGITRPQRVIVQPVDGGFETAFEVDRFDFEIVGGSVMRRLIGRTVRVRLVAMALQEGT